MYTQGGGGGDAAAHSKRPKIRDIKQVKQKGETKPMW